MAGGTNGLGRHEVETQPQAQDATEAALISLLGKSMSENTAVTRAGFEQLSKDIRQVLYALVAVLGLGLLTAMAGSFAVVGAGMYIKAAGIEIHTASSPVDVAGR